MSITGDLQKWFRIDFDNASRCFMPGDRVIGRLDIGFAKPKTVRSIAIRICGEAKTHWTRRHTTNTGQTTTTHTRTYKSVETYFNQQLILLGEQNMPIPAGRLVLPFEFILPEQCPPTFIGIALVFTVNSGNIRWDPTSFCDGFRCKHGSISYNCTAVIDRPGLLTFNKTVEAAIRLVGHANIDNRLLMQQPFSVCASASVGFMGRGLVAIQVQIPRRIFAVGESIDISAQLTNSSQERVKRIDISLIEYVRYTAERDLLFGKQIESRNESTTVCECSEPIEIASDASAQLHRSIIVPLTTQSIANCRIITIEYRLHLQVVTSALFSRRVGVDLPIVISNSMRRRFDLPIQQQQQQNPFALATAPPSSDDSYQLPPPSYDECAKSGRNMR